MLDFEEVVFFAVNFDELFDQFVDFFFVFGKDEAWQMGGHAAAEDDEAFAVLLEQFVIDARFVVEAFEMGEGGEFEEVFVALVVFGEDGEVVWFDIDFGFFVVSGAVGAVKFAAEDWFDTLFFAGFVEFDQAVCDAVVSECDGRIAEFFGAFDNF